MKSSLLFILATLCLVNPVPERDLDAVTASDQDTEYSLVWSDEFDEAGAPDPTKWHHQVFAPANGSWFNGEEQHYTDRLENSIVEDGVLKIIARCKTFDNGQGAKSYTSARLHSKFAFTYARVDVRAKLPEGRGTWPAIWTLGRNINEIGGYWQTQGFGSTGWPETGEIDIMEHWGDSPNIIHWSNHTPAGFGGNPDTNKATIDNVSSVFHEYSIIWDEDQIRYLVDGEEYHVYNPANKTATNWPFDKPQYLLLNVAMGGIYQSEPRSIDPAFTESAMEIDYVRIYQRNNAAVRDAGLVDLKVNGVTIDGFSSDRVDYRYTLTGRNPSVPEVRFTPSNEDASVVVFNAGSVPGTTTVRVTAVDGVTVQDYTVEFLVEEAPLGVEGARFVIHPNPSGAFVRVDLSGMLVTPNLRVVDVTGNTVEVGISNDQQDLLLDIRSLSAGIYFIQLEVENVRSTRRFVKK